MIGKINYTIASATLILIVCAPHASAEGADFQSDLLSLQHEWAHANYETTGTKERRSAFEMVADHAHELTARYPTEVAAVAWEGIVLSTYAGEVSAFSAMKVAKEALARLQEAEAMNGAALDGGIYASLGALYSKVPGGFVGFGDDDIARAYFDKALTVDADNIDNNYFYAEFLVDQGEFTAALEALEKALNAEKNSDRPVFDAGRRAEIQELIQVASNQVASIR